MSLGPFLHLLIKLFALVRDGACSIFNIVKILHLLDGGCVEILARRDGNFQLRHRAPPAEDETESFVYISVVYGSLEAAEAAARRKYKL
jgi:hypothetical protein